MQQEKRVLDEVEVTFRACHTPNQLQQLHSKAASFQSNPDLFRKISFLYRNKPYGYYSQVKKSLHKIELAYKKDFNGDPGNPINGQVLGLFFNGQVRPNGKLESVSPFGKCRLVMPVNYCLNQNTNLYFADFYCNSAKHNHCVTVVATEPGPQDDFCALHLPKLDPAENPYVKIHPDNTVWMNHSKNLRVEIFFSGHVDTKVGYFSHTHIIGKGRSNPKGFPKRKDCNICKLS